MWFWHGDVTSFIQAWKLWFLKCVVLVLSDRETLHNASSLWGNTISRHKGRQFYKKKKKKKDLVSLCVQYIVTRNYFMVIFQVRVAALQCLVKIMSLYYTYMEHYMGPALFAVSCCRKPFKCVPMHLKMGFLFSVGHRY